MLTSFFWEDGASAGEAFSVATAGDAMSIAAPSLVVSSILAGSAEVEAAVVVLSSVIPRVGVRLDFAMAELRWAGVWAAC